MKSIKVRSQKMMMRQPKSNAKKISEEPVTPEITKELKDSQVQKELKDSQVQKELKEDNTDILETNVDNLNLGSDLTTNIIPVCDITTNDNLKVSCGKSLVMALTSWNFCLLVNVVIWLSFVGCLTAGLWDISFNNISETNENGKSGVKTNTQWVFWMMGTASFLTIGILVCVGLHNSSKRSRQIENTNPAEITI